MRSLLLSLALVAYASLFGTPSPAAVSAAPAAAPNAATGAHVSANWAGYVAREGSYSAVGATWTIPSANSASTLSTNAAWVGIGGTDSNDLIQAGTQAFVEGNRVSYHAWYETLPDYQQELPLKVRGGDSVTVFITETMTDIWRLVFVNNTTGERVEKDLPYHSLKSSAEWVVERPLVDIGTGRFSYLPLDNFGSVTFTRAYAVKDGAHVSLGDTGAEPLNMASNRRLLASASVITDDNTGFTVSRNASVSAPSPVSPDGITIIIGNRRGAWRVAR